MALLAGLVWFVKRTRRGQKQHVRQELCEKTELEGATGPNNPFLATQDHSNERKELASVAKHEMPGSAVQHEMSVSTRDVYGDRKAAQAFEMQ